MAQPPADAGRPDFEPARPLPPAPDHAATPAESPPTPTPQEAAAHATATRTSGGRTRRRLIAAAVAAVAIVGVAAAFIAGPGLARPDVASPAAVAPHVVVTVTPQPQPTTVIPLSHGDDLGRPISFHTAHGAGEFTVTTATWSTAGLIRPVGGEQYLSVEIVVRCTEGRLATSPISVVAGSGPANAVYGGPSGAFLPGSVIAAGAATTGRVAFSVTPGQTSIELLDEQLNPVATAKVPGP